MSKSAKFSIAGMLSVLVMLISAWFYAKEFDQQVDIEPSTSSLDSGITLFQEKRYTEALEIFEDIPDTHPQKWRALYFQGSTHIMLKDYQAAVVYLEQALALQPTQTQIMNSLGVAYFKLGNLKMSKAYFAAILEIEPGNEEARGLMDIMANLERQQPGAESREPQPEPESKIDD